MSQVGRSRQRRTAVHGFIIYVSGIFPDFYPFLDENIENEYKNCSVTCTAVLFYVSGFILKSDSFTAFY